MTYEVKTPLALSCSYFSSDEKQYWGFNAELITLWTEVLPNEAFARLAQHDHQCLVIDQPCQIKPYQGLKEILSMDLKAVEEQFDNTLVSAWLKVEPDCLIQIFVDSSQTTGNQSQ